MSFEPVTNTYQTGVGQVLIGIHPENAGCREYGCAIHAPSDHSKRDWPTVWSDDLYMLERIDPETGIHYPDPDEIAFRRRWEEN